MCTFAGRMPGVDVMFHFLFPFLGYVPAGYLTVFIKAHADGRARQRETERWTKDEKNGVGECDGVRGKNGGRACRGERNSCSPVGFPERMRRKGGCLVCLLLPPSVPAIPSFT